MLDLALHYDQGAVTLADIARRQGISLSYLEQLFARLRRHGLVDSIRGPGGGYNLAKDPEQISIAQIIVVINENIDATRCGGERNCDDDETCLTHSLLRASRWVMWRSTRKIARSKRPCRDSMHTH
jgi:Rrf2 family iron-sulfur cluster assembly transcriptional regulator